MGSLYLFYVSTNAINITTVALTNTCSVLVAQAFIVSAPSVCYLPTFNR